MSEYLLIAVVVLVVLWWLYSDAKPKNDCGCPKDKYYANNQPSCEPTHNDAGLADVATPIKLIPDPPVRRLPDGTTMENCVKFSSPCEQNRKIVEYKNGRYVMYEDNPLGVY